jgi:hypothetical protein
LTIINCVNNHFSSLSIPLLFDEKGAENIEKMKGFSA